MNQYNIWNQSASKSQTAPQHILPSSEGNFGSINHNQHPQQQQQPGFANAPASSPPDQSSLSPDALIARLNGLPTSSNYTNFIQSLDNPSVTQPYSDFDYDSHSNYSFHLPLELQGGVSSINSRRPSFAAEQTYTHTNSAQNFMAQPQFSLERFAQSNNFQMSQGNAQNTASFDFRSRRPSIQINSNYTTEHASPHPQQPHLNQQLLNQQQQHQQHQIPNETSQFYQHHPQQPQPHHQDQGSRQGFNNFDKNGFQSYGNGNSAPQYQKQKQHQQSQQQFQQHQHIAGGTLELENGLLLNNGVIVSSPALQQAFAKTKNYFCAESALSLYDDLCKKSAEIPFLQKVILNLKKLNNMFSLIKPVVLVLTKSGKYEILSIPANSNIRLQKNDVVIVDGDRGKDLVYVLAPSITLDVAILINYLKKRQHSKSISYGGTVQNNSGISNTVTDLVKGQGILDEETQFQIPTKQVLRFATYQEISNLQFKLIEEIKSFKTSLLKISNQPLLNGNLTILNSEYQFDQKKLTFFYYSNQRLDFRNLIKELFKIYKTRIWLCAVPKPEGQVTTELSNDVGIEDCLIDDFHVRSFANTLSELLAGA